MAFGEGSLCVGTARAVLILAGFLTLSLPLMPLQALLIRIAPHAARRLPHWYHKGVCRLVGLRVRVIGTLPPGQPVLIAANHTSWLDIPVLSAMAPVSFVAKREVLAWPFVGALARLQRTVFVDRTRRAAVGPTTDELARRLANGDTVVLFAEGTSSDGNRVLPFMSSLFSAVARDDTPGGIAVVPIAVTYVSRYGVPLGREQRPEVAWYGDMEMRRHAWAVLRGGPLDVEVRVGTPIAGEDRSDRKRLAEAAETDTRHLLVATLRGLPKDSVLEVARRLPRKTSLSRPGGRRDGPGGLYT